MAFDQHIAADQIDEFNLFSAFVRIPLLILGGVLGSRSSGSKNIGSHLEGDDDCQQSTTTATTASSVHPLQSDVCISHVDDDPANRRIVSDFSMDDCEGTGMTRAKKMSWSDESGKRLVVYDDESIPYEPSPYSSTSSTPRPVKSAMRRSRSVRQDANGMQHLSSQDSTATSTRYIPNMNRAGNGLIMPTRPFGGSSNHAVAQGDQSVANGASSEMSPQWGWYINTTPPTPEMYHSESRRLLRTADVRGAPCPPHFAHHDAASASEDGRRYQNHVFQTLQSSNAPMGWTSVPI